MKVAAASIATSCFCPALVYYGMPPWPNHGGARIFCRDTGMLRVGIDDKRLQTQGIGMRSSSSHLDQSITSAAVYKQSLPGQRGEMNSREADLLH